jgi:hypothetical protein
MGLVQPEVRGDAYNAHFLRCKAAITLEQSGTKQTTNIAVKIRKFGRPGSGQLGRDVICEGCSVCAILYRVAIDALQMRIISRCNETYHLTTRQRRSVHRFNDFISRRREVPDLRYDVLSLPQTREVSSLRKKRDDLERSYGNLHWYQPCSATSRNGGTTDLRGRMLNPPETGKLIRTSHTLEGS